MGKKGKAIVLFLLTVIFLGGLYLRVESVRHTTVVAPLRADAGQYYMYAYNLRHKHTYSREPGHPRDLDDPVTPDAARPPGYPLFLTPFVPGLPTQDILENIQVFQAGLSTLTLIVSFLFFRGFLPLPLAVAASFLAALSPHLIVAPSFLLTETLFTFLLVAFFWLLSLFARRPTPWFSLFTGLVLGMASLVRPALQYFLPCLAPLMVSQFGWKRGRRVFALLVLGFALIISPWIIRNMITLKTPTDQRLMINFLHHGLYPDFTFDQKWKTHGYPYLADPRSREIGKDLSSVLEEMARRFSQEPVRHIKWFFLGKPVAFWSWDNVQGILGDIFIYPVSSSPYFTNPLFQGAHFLMFSLHWPLVILAATGCILAWFPLFKLEFTQNAIFLIRATSLLLIYYTLVHMAGAPFPRYAIPLRPFLYGMALFCPYLLFRALKTGRGSK